MVDLRLLDRRGIDEEAVAMEEGIVLECERVRREGEDRESEIVAAMAMAAGDCHCRGLVSLCKTRGF